MPRRLKLPRARYRASSLAPNIPAGRYRKSGIYVHQLACVAIQWTLSGGSVSGLVYLCVERVTTSRFVSREMDNPQKGKSTLGAARILEPPGSKPDLRAASSVLFRLNQCTSFLQYPYAFGLTACEAV